MKIILTLLLFAMCNSIMSQSITIQDIDSIVIDHIVESYPKKSLFYVKSSRGLKTEKTHKRVKWISANDTLSYYKRCLFYNNYFINLGREMDTLTYDSCVTVYNISIPINKLFKQDQSIMMLEDNFNYKIYFDNKNSVISKIVFIGKQKNEVIYENMQSD